ncbi:HAD family hydrolase, partial [bacterium]|nr:HAD family hydrolase [bacterium]
MRLKKYRHLIWDWNGTLLDDAWLCREIMNGQLRRRGLP